MKMTKEEWEILRDNLKGIRYVKYEYNPGYNKKGRDQAKKDLENGGKDFRRYVHESNFEEPYLLFLKQTTSNTNLSGQFFEWNYFENDLRDYIDNVEKKIKELA